MTKEKKIKICAYRNCDKPVTQRRNQYCCYDHFRKERYLETLDFKKWRKLQDKIREEESLITISESKKEDLSKISFHEWSKPKLEEYRKSENGIRKSELQSRLDKLSETEKQEYKQLSNEYDKYFWELKDVFNKKKVRNE